MLTDNPTTLLDFLSRFAFPFLNLCEVVLGLVLGPWPLPSTSPSLFPYFIDTSLISGLLSLHKSTILFIFNENLQNTFVLRRTPDNQLRTMNRIPGLKKTTGLTGMEVVHNPEHHLRVLYNKILRIMKKIPPDAAYRKYTEALVTQRLQHVVDSKSPVEIEQKISCGQAEELILQAEKELAFARSALVWKPWEPLIEAAPPNQWNWPPVK